MIIITGSGSEQHRDLPANGSLEDQFERTITVEQLDFNMIS